MESDNAENTLDWRRAKVSRLVLGTVQLGMPYGIANVHGQPDVRQARGIVEAAWRGGIRYFDTAQAYGNSEAVLGQALGELGLTEEARVITKLAAAMNPYDIEALEQSIDASMQRLRTDFLWGVMLHTPQWLEHWDSGLGDVLLRRQRAGQIGFLGVSMSPPEDAPQCLAHPDLAMIQAPCNAWDRRLARNDFFEQARTLNKLVFVRSIYLQGLLALTAEEAARRLPRAAPAAQRWHALAGRWHLTPAALAMRFALGLDTPLVVGAETPAQLWETLALAQQPALSAAQYAELDETMEPVLEPAILEPWRWPKQ